MRNKKIIRYITFILVGLMILSSLMVLTEISHASGTPKVTQTLVRGSVGTQVRYLQQRLKALGYNVGGIDGSFGPQTLSAVRAFQRDNNLAVDGSVGPATRAKLNGGQSSSSGSSSKPSSSSSNTPKVTQTLVRGSVGTQVRYLQQRLKALGYNVGSIDGSFGPQTLSAVRAFQRDNNLAVDGSVGPATRAKLNSSKSNSNGSNSKPSKPSGNLPKVTQTLVRGSVGTQVKYLQQKLKALGYNVGSIDSSFGPQTLSAVRAFQKDNNLAVDGSVGPATRKKLNAAKPESEEDSKPEQPEKPKPEKPQDDIPKVTQTLVRGSVGTQVKYLQRKLKALGYNVGSIDGSFGPQTLSAVRAFQRDNNLAVDGSVGPATRKKLNAAKPESEEDDKDTEDKYEEFEPEAGSLKGKTVFIDAGHGGNDSGATRDGVYEKDLTLAMALRLERILKKAGATVIMTRDKDETQELFYRSAVVNEHIVKEELKSKEKELDKIKGEITNLNEDKEKLGKDIKELDEDKLEDEIEELKTNIVELKSEINNKNEELEKDLSSIVEDLKEIIKVLEPNEEELESLGSIVNSLQIIIEDKDFELDEELNNILNDLIKDFKDRIENLEDSNEELEDLEDLKDLEESEDLEEGPEDLKDLEKQLENSSDFKELMNDLSEFLKELKSSFEEPKSNLNRLEEELERTENQPQEFKSSNKVLKELEDEINDRKVLRSDLEEQILSLKNKKKLLEEIIKNPTNASRRGIYRYSDSSKKVINNDLKEIFEITKSNYEEDIIFVSVHVNSYVTDQPSGVRAYYRPSNMNDHKNYYNEYSDGKRKDLASSMLKYTTKYTDFKGKDSNPRTGNFSVIREQNLPSVLMEIGFISNSRDRKLLQQKQTQENAARGMYQGIVEYFK